MSTRSNTSLRNYLGVSLSVVLVLYVSFLTPLNFELLVEQRFLLNSETSIPVYAALLAVFLAGLLPGVAVVVCPDRYLAGRHALERLDPAPDLFLLDDGFSLAQIRRLLDDAPTGDADAVPPREAGADRDARLLEAIDLYTGVAGRVDDTEARRLLDLAARELGLDPAGLAAALRSMDAVFGAPA